MKVKAKYIGKAGDRLPLLSDIKEIELQIYDDEIQIGIDGYGVATYTSLEVFAKEWHLSELMPAVSGQIYPKIERIRAAVDTTNAFCDRLPASLVAHNVRQAKAKVCRLAEQYIHQDEDVDQIFLTLAVYDPNNSNSANPARDEVDK